MRDWHKFAVEKPSLKGHVRLENFATKTCRAGGADLSFLTLTAAGQDVADALSAALKTCDAQIGLKTVVRQTVFLGSTDDRRAAREAIRKAYGEALPATTYTYQPPADSSPAGLEMWAFSGGAGVARGPVTTACAGGVRWGFIGGGETCGDEGPYEGVARMLKEAQASLSDAGFNLADLVRTWFYIGDLLADEDGSTRYDRLNQARNESFQDIWKDLRYSPASTGIGMRTRRVAFEGAVVKGEAGALEVKWVDNPLQTNPFAYDIEVNQARKPSFSRAAAVRLADSMLLFISGTASIRKSEVVHATDVAAQTATTIENIRTLIGGENLAGNHGLPAGATLEDIQQFRVYVKRGQDVGAVRDCCDRLLPYVPGIYVIADVCRKQCLVEIEAVAAVRL